MKTINHKLKEVRKYRKLPLSKNMKEDIIKELGCKNPDLNTNINVRRFK